jgi:hypothetical protein
MSTRADQRGMPMDEDCALDDIYEPAAAGALERA